ncbi:MAG: cyclic nucleotide-binding domain-containing protein [Nitrospirae bacterium]|nr:cyclic nucleotide-binding domain-containing protein [Nitrospirota bacterium]
MSKNYFFGKYLIDRELVKVEDVLEALQYQKKKVQPFEKVAIELGFLDMKQVFQILTYQADSDFTFEEMALKKKFMTQEQVDRVKNYIEDQKPFIGNTLVMLSKISEDVMKHELETYEKVIEKHQRIAEMLKHIVLFKFLNESALESLAYIAEIEEYEPNARIVIEGEAADCFYCVVSGALQVTKNNPEQEEQEVYLSNIEKNDVFGESCVFESGRRTANVNAEVMSLLIRFDKNAFIEFIKHHPKASMPILIFIIQRLMARLENTGRELAYVRKQSTANYDVNTLIQEFL